MSSKKILIPDQNVIEGWNKKLNMRSEDLSGLVPFLELYAVYTSEEFNVIENNIKKGSQDLINKACIVTVKNDPSNTYRNGTVIHIIRMGRIESQLQSVHYSGGVGLGELSITKGVKEAFNVRYDLSITVMDPKIFDYELEYSKLITLNSPFIIIYGWASGNSTYFNNPPRLSPGSKEELNFSSENLGFWKATICNLYKFDFNFESSGHLEGSLSFIAPQTSILTFMRASRISANTISILEGNTSSFSIHNIKRTLISNGLNESSIPSKMGMTVKFPNTRSILDEDGNTVGEEEVMEERLEYFYLGWVLEAIKFVLHSIKDELKISFVYKNIEESTVKILVQEFLNSSNVDKNTFNTKNFNNVFQLPVRIEDIKDILSAFNCPILEMIKNIVGKVKDVFPVDIGIRNVDSSIELFVLNSGAIDTITKMKQNKFHTGEFLDIDFGSRNSLCESLDLSSKLDPNAFETYQIPVLLGNRSINLFEKIKNVNLLDELTLFLEDNRIEYEKLENVPTNTLSSFLQQEPTYFTKVIQSLFNEGNIFGNILGFYLKRTTVTIHGIVGINAFNMIRIRGLIKGIEGIYNVLQVTEQVNTNGFTTVLECSLVESFNLNI